MKVSRNLLSFTSLLLLLIIKHSNLYLMAGSSTASLRLGDVILSSVPTQLKDCSFLLLHSNSAGLTDITFETLLGGLKSQDKYLLNLPDKNITEKFFEITDVHKLRPHCILAVIQMEDAQNLKNTSDTVYGILQRLDGIVKKDEDYFIFYSEQEDSIKTLFSSGPVASGVKNKVGIRLSKNTSIISFYSTCFFCASGGFPILNVISIVNQASEGFSLSSSSVESLFPDLLQDFHGKEFTVSTPTLARWLVEIRQTSSGNWVNRRGVMNSALMLVMRKYNCTGRHFPSIGGGGTGYRFPNGTWIGVVGDVLSGAAEIGQTVGHVYSRNKVVGFSFPVVYEWLTFTTGKPRPHYSWKSVYWPFTPLIWLLVITSTLLTFFSLTFLLKATSQRRNATKTTFYIVRTFLEQDAKSMETRPTNTIRMFMAFWLIFALLITTSYRSKLVSVLAFPVVDEPPATFVSLAQATKFEIALQYLRGAAYTLMKTSPNPTFQTIFQRMQLEENDAQCFQRAIGKPFSCISWDSVASFVYHKNLSDKNGNVPLVKSQDTSTFIAVGIIFQKRVVYRTKFNSVIFRAFDMGFMGKWKEVDYEFIRNERREWERATNRSQVVYAHDLKDILTLQNLSGTFGLLTVGLLGGLLVFVSETSIEAFNKFYSRRKASRNSAAVGVQMITMRGEREKITVQSTCL